MTATEVGCGRPTKGSGAKDSTLPCGTKVTFGKYKEDQTTRVLLCDKCKGAK
jgi:hypothetical protein